WLRVGGRGRGADGASVVWSVAEGSRGRRWREVRNAGGAVATSLLLETDPAGQFAHLELATPSGLLTLHPEGDGTLHGHAIVSDGVEHVEGLAWDADGIVLLDGSTVCRLAAAALLADVVAAGTSKAHLAVTIPPTLWIEVKPVRVERVDAATWRFGTEEPLAVDDRGLPSLRGGEIWPLERDEDPAPRHR
ncbi:MAG TPA: hypothetical protein VK194_03220, partial [Candidatus Deferrimicrobium sp.]|nr:hypothetical protein [Candidatus Deferrimicrobium sp.]